MNIIRIKLLFIIYFFSSLLSASNLEVSNVFFDFAEENYPQYFSPAGSETFEIDYQSNHYLARYYKETDTYVGTLGEDVYVYGDIFNGLLHVGKISDYIEILRDPSEPTISTNTNLTPQVSELPGFQDAEPRFLARVSGEDGEQVDFIENELWLSTDNEAELADFLSRWNGKILADFKPADFGVSGISNQYLVRIDSSAAEVSRFSEYLLKLDPNSHGKVEVSSTDGANLLAASAAEAAAGLKVGLNWVPRGGNFRGKSTTEAPSGSSYGGSPHDPNAFNWFSHNIDSNQNIGIAEAWRVLDLAGKLENKIKIAILDMGFKPDADFPDDWVAISNVPFVNPTGTENLIGCGGGNPCLWHGTNVLSSAMAVPDNNYGSAGPAGPIGDAILIFTSYDMFTSITALGEAKLAGAKIANMSYGAPIPSVLFFSVLPFEAATLAFHKSGMLLFAAAGNDGKNVDSGWCIPLAGCIEKTWYTPCENAGVICVGGLSVNSKNKASGSNYGSKQVDIFAPYTLLLGPDPENPNNRTQVKNGTSFSSPFAAGVAALIWASNPNLSANEVENILMDTAHTSPDEDVDRYVNALGAVQKVLGNVPPSIQIVSHEDGDEFERHLNVPFNLSATVSDFKDGNNCCILEWSSDKDGVLGTGLGLQTSFNSIGKRLITVSTENSGGTRSSVSVTIDVVNTPPTVEISSPTSGVNIFQGTSSVFRATSSDINEPDRMLACDSLIWTSSFAGDPFPVSGCEGEVIFSSNGARTLTLTGTDTQGESAVASVSFDVIDAPLNLPPSVIINAPSNIGTNELVTFNSVVTDPEGDVNLNYEWKVSYKKDSTSGSVIIGNTPNITVMLSDSIPFDNGGEGRWTVNVSLNVSDSEGNTGTDSVPFEFIIIN